MIAINSKLIAEIKIDNLNEIVAEELGKILNRCTLSVEYDDWIEEHVGRWIKKPDTPYYQCSECDGIVTGCVNGIGYRYCPYCGCKMEVDDGTSK